VKLRELSGIRRRDREKQVYDEGPELSFKRTSLTYHYRMYE
jgi:hypothetical protein